MQAFFSVQRKKKILCLILFFFFKEKKCRNLPRNSQEHFKLIIAVMNVLG